MRLTNENRIRKEIAEEAAKLILKQGMGDYLQAKKKAAMHLGINNKQMFPSNSEIESALINYQALFHPQEYEKQLINMRQTAYKIMSLLKEYEPYLVGPVLTGTVNQSSEITLHLFTDAPELVVLFLEQNGIPAETCERRLKIERQKPTYFTAYKFIAGELDIVLIVLPYLLKKSAPIDPITDRPMQRANLKKVEKLIN